MKLRSGRHRHHQVSANRQVPTRTPNFKRPLPAFRRSRRGRDEDLARRAVSSPLRAWCQLRARVTKPLMEGSSTMHAPRDVASATAALIGPDERPGPARLGVGVHSELGSRSSWRERSEIGRRIADSFHRAPFDTGGTSDVCRTPAMLRPPRRRPRARAAVVRHGQGARPRLVQPVHCQLGPPCHLEECRRLRRCHHE